MAEQKTISLSGSVEMVQEFFEFAINRCAPLRRARANPEAAPRAQHPLPARHLPAGGVQTRRQVRPVDDGDERRGPEIARRPAPRGRARRAGGGSAARRYLSKILSQLKTWLNTGEVQRLVVVVTGVETGQTLERWVFAVQAFAEGENAENAAPEAKTAAVKEITKQIQAIIRQITASVTFLPLLEEACAFDLLVYARKKADVPGTWEDSDPKYITNAQEVKLRSFTTSIHQVEAAVSYKADDV